MHGAIKSVDNGEQIRATEGVDSLTGCKIVALLQSLPFNQHFVFGKLISPLCKGQATEERHIFSEGGRGGIPKSEF